MRLVWVHLRPLIRYRACHVSQGCSLQRSTFTEVVAVQTILDGADLSMATFATCAPPCYTCHHTYARQMHHSRQRTQQYNRRPRDARNPW